MGLKRLMTDFLVVSDYSKMTSWPGMKYKTSSLTLGTKPICLVHNYVLSCSCHYNKCRVNNCLLVAVSEAVILTWQLLPGVTLGAVSSM